jgi:ferredoxin
MIGKKAVIDLALCLGCRVCFRVCSNQAVVVEDIDTNPLSRESKTVECSHCPIKCRAQEGSLGACRRYLCKEGTMVRLDSPLSYESVKSYITPQPKVELNPPVITAIGLGTTYPDNRPAPGIVSQKRGLVEVVTVATEVPLSYSSCLLKIDTDVYLGDEGSPVIFEGREVGRLETEQYGSKMIHLGGVNRFTQGSSGFAAVRSVISVLNRLPLKLRIKNGVSLELTIGLPPIIDGQTPQKMRVGCGSATTGIFAPLLAEAANEVIILDSHITGLLSGHVAGIDVGVKPSGIELVFPQSTPGRYFGDHGKGWGGTSITSPEKIIKSIDLSLAQPGFTVLITETTGLLGAMFEIQTDGSLKEISLTAKAREVLEAIQDTCEASLVSAIYMAGSGGSARAGVCRYPIKLTRAIHQNKVLVTVGGAPAYVLPGGGITFMVDAAQVKPGSFSWTPTPATICPLEYTMELSDFKAMGGHVEAMKPFKANLPSWP